MPIGKSQFRSHSAPLGEQRIFGKQLFSSAASLIRREEPTRMYQIEQGKSHPLGTVPDAQGVNFSLFSAHATSVELLLFAEHDDLTPLQVIPLDPLLHRTFHFWHVYVRGLRPGVHYAYRLDGSQDVHGPGHRFQRNKVVIDPYSRGITTTLWNRAEAVGPGDNLRTSMRSAVIDASVYDWEGDLPLNRPMSETIIYEVHVGSFTKSPSAGCQYPGTFAGLIEKIPYLQELGITAVELLPIFAFDERDISWHNPLDGTPLKNYWGYSPVAHFAPHAAYCVSPEVGSHLDDFRELVKALHRAGIEVILDVVYNHTGEGNHLGPTISFKCLDNSVYYYLNPQDRQYYLDYSGCGNTLNCNHPLVEKLIAESLEFWVKEMHVDGFRFDEGSILSRDSAGLPMQYPPVVWRIELEEALADAKVIVEAWDAAGLYQVGSFPGVRWAEWNGRYRDTMRQFVRGDPGLISAVASRLAGSPDIYQATGHTPINSINYITSHDGFTLNDLVSYNEKHNEANGEGNRDGANDNFSWNGGVEGPTCDPAIEVFRERQIKNLLAILLLSQGVPMLLGGDEFRRSQQGNNNAYCQDNATSWFDWTLLEAHQDLFRFVKRMIAFRKSHPNLHRERFFTGAPDQQGQRDIVWHGCRLLCPGWDDSASRVLAFTIWGRGLDKDLHVILNMEPLDLNFDVPASPDKTWMRVVDTSLASPLDVADDDQRLAVTENTYHAGSHSVVVLVAEEQPV